MCLSNRVSSAENQMIECLIHNCISFILFNTYVTSVVPTALLLQCNWPIKGIQRVL